MLLNVASRARGLISPFRLLPAHPSPLPTCLASFSSGNTLSSLQALPQADFLLGGLPPPSDSWSPFIGPSFYSPLCFLFTALLPLIIILFLCVLVCGPPPRWGLGAPGAGTPSVLAVCIPSSAHGPLCVSGVCSLLEEGMMNK